MNIISICPNNYNLEQAKGIIYWINKHRKTKSFILRLVNINNILVSYFLLIIYFVFLQWITFIELKEKYDYVFVTGKSVVAQSIIIADQLKIPVCTIQKPFGYPSWLFKFQIIPTHDWYKSSPKNNIHFPIAPNTYKFFPNINREKIISILIGGSLHGKKCNIENIIDCIKQVKKNYYKKKINIITSRRTPKILIRKINNLGYCINDKYGSVKDAYYNSEIILISDDSFCMISEVIQSGNMPYIIETGNIGKRLKLGIKILEKKGYLQYYNKDIKLKFNLIKDNLLEKINKSIINEFTTV